MALEGTTDCGDIDEAVSKIKEQGAWEVDKGFDAVRRHLQRHRRRQTSQDDDVARKENQQLLRRLEKMKSEVRMLRIESDRLKDELRQQKEVTAATKRRQLLSRRRPSDVVIQAAVAEAEEQDRQSNNKTRLMRMEEGESLVEPNSRYGLLTAASLGGGYNDRSLHPWWWLPTGFCHLRYAAGATVSGLSKP